MVQSVAIDSVTVTASRPLRNTGVNRTVIDSTVLHQNISLSISDVLSQHSAIFIKSYGRATMSTASMRGSSPSHTLVRWNGMKINSPSLGMVDFSMLPACFVDNVEVMPGASSIGSGGGGLGGSVELTSRANVERGWQVKYIQGIESYSTFDEFVRLGWAGNRLRLLTRVMFDSSDNDFKYVNRDKLPQNIYDNSGNLVERRYPTERNRSCEYNDAHLLQQAGYDMGRAGQIDGAVWLTDSHHGIPRLGVDYRAQSLARNYQDEQSLRGSLGWRFHTTRLSLELQGGYSASNLLYVSQIDLDGQGSVVDNIRSRTQTRTFHTALEGEYALTERVMIALNATVDRNSVVSQNEVSLTQTEPNRMARIESSLFAALRWRPFDRFGAALNLREESYGTKLSPLIPALLLDWAVVRSGAVTAKCSVARNYRYPTLNDLYFVPGGNRDLRPERGITGEAGFEWRTKVAKTGWDGEVSLFRSEVDDWILWLPTHNGYGHPVNVRSVESRGAELRTGLDRSVGRQCTASLEALLTYTRSESLSDPNDPSSMRQLPYIPRWSGAVTAQVDLGQWTLNYKWSWYSKRFTALADDNAVWSSVAAYVMNDLSIGRSIETPICQFKVRFDVRNLFDEEYRSVLSRPMPGRNYALYIEIKPHQKRK